MNILKKGTDLVKVRDKGVRGVKTYRRRYRLNIPDLKITYHPNKASSKTKGCLAGEGEADSGQLWHDSLSLVS